MKYLVDYDGIEKNILSGSYVVSSGVPAQGLPRRHRRQALQARRRQAKELLAAAKLDQGSA